MSLINEALKKAQRQRMEAPVTLPPPSNPGANATEPRIAKRRPPMPVGTQILLFFGGGAVLIMAGVFAFLFLVPEKPPVEVARPPAAVPTPVVVQPVANTPAPAPEPAVAPQPQPVAPTPPPAAVAVTPPPAQPAETPAPIAPVVAPTAPVVAPTTSVTATRGPNPKVYEFLEKLRISGIRVSDTDPKVIMNDRVFRLNDVVDRITQLRLTRIEASTLIFVDASGFEYRKNF